MTTSKDTSVFFNPDCSKCQTLASYLQNEEVTYIHYLETAPSRGELIELMEKLGIDDPKEMIRKGEPIYQELSLDSCSKNEVLDAMTQNPILLERPILVKGSRAIIARPPERVVEILDIAID